MGKKKRFEYVDTSEDYYATYTMGYTIDHQKEGDEQFIEERELVKILNETLEELEELKKRE